MLVDPTHLHAAAQEQAVVGGSVSRLVSGELVAGSGADLAGLASASACQTLGAAFGVAITAAHERLTDHADKLNKAAGHYQRTDQEFGDRLRSFVPQT